MENEFKLELEAGLSKDSGQKIQDQLNKLDGMEITVEHVKLGSSAIEDIKKTLKQNKIDLQLNLPKNAVVSQAKDVGSAAAKEIQVRVEKGLRPLSELKISSTKDTAAAIFDNNGLVDAEQTLAKIKKTYSEFGQVHITDKLFDRDGSLQSFKVNITQVNGELKETRKFMMQLSGSTFGFPEDGFKGAESFVRHLNDAKNIVNATGDEVNATKKKLEEQQKYYAKLKLALKDVYSLQAKLVSAGEQESKVLEKQLKAAKERVRYNEKQINQKGLKDKNRGQDVYLYEKKLQNDLAAATAKTADVIQKRLNVEMANTAKTAQRIKDSFDVGKYSAQFKKAESDLQKYGNKQGQVAANATALKTAYDNLVLAAQEFATSGDASKLISAQKNFQAELDKSRNKVRELNIEGSKVDPAKNMNLSNKIQAWMQKNTRAAKDFGHQCQLMIETLKDADDVTFKNINSQFNKMQNDARAAGKLGKSLKDQLMEAAESFGQWLTVSAVIMSLTRAIKNFVVEVHALDDSMTDLRMATGYTAEQATELLDTYNKLGDQLSATTTDVAAAASEWLRQGKTLAETNELIKDSMVLSKIANIESEQSTKYLTSAMKAYGVATEDVIGIVDKLSAVDMVSATDVGGLAEGMSQVAANAKLAGVEMDTLLGYLAAIGETTQEGMSSVGTALNAVFSRMGNIKLARLKDYQNSGEDLSNVETVLRGEGISLRDSTNTFRNFAEVLDEVAGKWASFSEVSQRAIASAFAGTNHMESFIVLMQQYGNAMSYSQTAAESSGQAMQKFAAYQESITGKTERFANAFQSLSSTVVDSDIVKAFIDLGTVGVKSLDTLIGKLGSLELIIGAVGAKFAMGKGLDYYPYNPSSGLQGSDEMLLPTLTNVGQNRNEFVYTDKSTLVKTRDISVRGCAESDDGNTRTRTGTVLCDLLYVA